MLTFISWSGAQSKFVADALGSWLQQVIQAVDPWLSFEIDKGARWASEVADQLENSKIGIICLTKDNLNEPWIVFEAGALSKTKEAYVCTLLIDLKHVDVKQPLAQFQHTSFVKEDIWKLVKTINNKVAECGERGLAESVLKEVFETYWPKLNESYVKALDIKPSVATKVREDREVLEEILDLVRNQQRYTMNLDGGLMFDDMKLRPSLRGAIRQGLQTEMPKRTAPPPGMAPTIKE